MVFPTNLKSSRFQTRSSLQAANGHGPYVPNFYRVFQNEMRFCTEAANQTCLTHGPTVYISQGRSHLQKQNQRSQATLRARRMRWSVVPWQDTLGSDLQRTVLIINDWYDNSYMGYIQAPQINHQTHKDFHS